MSWYAYIMTSEAVVVRLALLGAGSTSSPSNPALTFPVSCNTGRPHVQDLGSRQTIKQTRK